MNIDRFLDRKYNVDSYNCGHYVAEVYRELGGRNIDHICKAFYEEGRDKFLEALRDLQRLESPESPCLALMKTPNCEQHAGVFIEGRILHLSHDGAKLEELNLIKLHYRVSFYK